MLGKKIIYLNQLNIHSKQLFHYKKIKSILCKFYTFLMFSNNFSFNYFSFIWQCLVPPIKNVIYTLMYDVPLLLGVKIKLNFKKNVKMNINFNEILSTGVKSTARLFLFFEWYSNVIIF